MIFTFADLKYVARFLSRCVEMRRAAAEDSTAFLDEISTDADLAVNEGGKEIPFTTPSGKLGVVHWWWQRGISGPVEFSVWFNTGDGFSFLLPGMKHPIDEFGRKIRKKVCSDRWHPTQCSECTTLISASDEPDCVSFQLVVWLARHQRLAPEAENEAFVCFENAFKESVRGRRFHSSEFNDPSEARRSILGEAWMRIRKSYCLPVGPDGFTRYARAVIYALNKPKFDRNSVQFTRAGELTTPREAAAVFDIRERTIYSLIARGIVPAQKLKKEITLLPGWDLELRTWKDKKEERKSRAALNKELAKAWAESREITVPSAKTQVKRWRLAGLCDQEIIEKIRRSACRPSRSQSNESRVAQQSSQRSSEYTSTKIAESLSGGLSSFPDSS